jgi:UDP-N-acetylmuramoyl-tripeptide--D-alanyl-D-alanine ligase
MRAAIALLAEAPIGQQGRRIAVLGDMLELGPQSGELHRSLANVIGEKGIDLVFCSGPLMHHLWEALPSRARGGYAETAAALEPAVLEAIRCRRRRDGEGVPRFENGSDRQGIGEAIPKQIALERAPG